MSVAVLRLSVGGQWVAVVLGWGIQSEQLHICLIIML